MFAFSVEYVAARNAPSASVLQEQHFANALELIDCINKIDHRLALFQTRLIIKYAPQASDIQKKAEKKEAILMRKHVVHRSTPHPEP